MHSDTGLRFGAQCTTQHQQQGPCCWHAATETLLLLLLLLLRFSSAVRFTEKKKLARIQGFAVSSQDALLMRHHSRQRTNVAKRWEERTSVGEMVSTVLGARDTLRIWQRAATRSNPTSQVTHRHVELSLISPAAERWGPSQSAAPSQGCIPDPGCSSETAARPHRLRVPDLQQRDSGVG